MSTTSRFVVPSTSTLPDISNSVPTSFCVSVTTPSLAIAIASVSPTEPICPALAIVIPPL
jgi:hypothetical protein